MSEGVGELNGECVEVICICVIVKAINRDTDSVFTFRRKASPE